jgi:hypothetical protein
MKPSAKFDPTPLSDCSRYTESRDSDKVRDPKVYAWPARDECCRNKQRRSNQDACIDLHPAQCGPEPRVEMFQRNFSQVVDSSPRRVTVESPSVP